MTAVAATPRAEVSPRARTLLDRALAALPLATVFLWACLIYAYQAWAHKTPWLFSDEIEYTSISRSIATTGHPAIRGVPHSFDSLYTYLLAPVWWIHSTGIAYSVAKDLNVLVMTAAIFPTYALARMLVRPVPALVAAALAVTVPALSYSAFIITEPLAYFWTALTCWLIVKAMVGRRWPWILAATVATLAASFVRTELKVLLAVAVGAIAWFLWTSGAAVGFRSRWKRWHWAVFGLGCAVLAYAVYVLGSRHSTSFHTTFVVLPDRTLRYGVWAAGALTIGLGVLPVVAGLTTLARPKEPRTPAQRAFVGLFGSAIVAFCIYTAAKAAYLSTVFAILVEERNVIYLTPLIAVAFAVWLDRPRVNLVALGLSSAAVGYLIWATPYQLSIHPYADAPGLAALAWGNRHFRWDDTTARWILYGMLAYSIVLVAVVSFRERWAKLARPVLAVSALAVLAWGLTGEISAANGSNSLANRFYNGLPHPLNWIDRADGGAPATFLGTGIQDGNGVWSFEFWNRSLQKVGSFDGSAPGPGSTLRPVAYKPDGEVLNDPQTPYVLADQAVDIAGTPVARNGVFTLLHVHGPLRLRSSTTGITTDGWSGANASYSRYAVPTRQHGTLSVRLSRQGWTVPGHVVFQVGNLVSPSESTLQNPCKTTPCASLEPRIGKITAVRRWDASSGGIKLFTIPVTTPFRVELSVDPTFQPAKFGKYDTRELGVQPSFTFTPDH